MSTHDTEKKKLGLYDKYTVKRADSQDEPGCKHYGCKLFVLDLTHDPFAKEAVHVYADLCGRAGFHKLAVDLKVALQEAERQRTAYVRDEATKLLVDAVGEHTFASHRFYSTTAVLHNTTVVVYAQNEQHAVKVLQEEFPDRPYVVGAKIHDKFKHEYPDTLVYVTEFEVAAHVMAQIWLRDQD